MYTKCRQSNSFYENWGELAGLADYPNLYLYINICFDINSVHPDLNEGNLGISFGT